MAAPRYSSPAECWHHLADLAAAIDPKASVRILELSRNSPWLPGTLMTAFVWADTLEGDVYWEELHFALKVRWPGHYPFRVG